MYTRTQTRPIFVGGLQIGGQDKVVIQSMTTTKSRNVQETVQQILELEDAGCQIVRLACLTKADADAIALIKPLVHIPLVADIHFDYKIALAAIAAGADKIRLNPGNIGKKENIIAVVEACKEKKIPIRIGVNGGSLEKDIEKTYGHNSPQGMIESAKRHVKILEDLGFYDIAISLKSSDVRTTIEAYQLAAETFPYPLHLGVTEAGTYTGSAIKSSAALGVLLHQGIGDTIRISVSDVPVKEIHIAKELLHNFGLWDNHPTLVACPTCGRLQFDMFPVVNEMERYLNTIHENITVAVMGCVVNGVGEGKSADIAFCGGVNEGLLIKQGELIRKISQENAAEELKIEIQNFLAERRLSK